MFQTPKIIYYTRVYKKGVKNLYLISKTKKIGGLYPPVFTLTAVLLVSYAVLSI